MKTTWQTIDSAPLDDSWVLVTGSSGYMRRPYFLFAARFNTYKKRWEHTEDCDLSAYGLEPTHWMPLLDTPNKKEDREGDSEAEAGRESMIRTEAEYQAAKKEAAARRERLQAYGEELTKEGTYTAAEIEMALEPVKMFATELEHKLGQYERLRAVRI